MCGCPLLSVPPTLAHVGNSSQLLENGVDTSFSFMVVGDVFPPVMESDVVWTHSNGSALRSLMMGGAVSFSSSARTLHLSQVQRGDAGTYTATVTTAAGVGAISFTLDVYGMYCCL